MAGGALSSAELFDSGLGFSNAWQPTITTVTSLLSAGAGLTLGGAQFRGISEASGGNGSQDSSSDYPLVQLRGLESGRTMFLRPTNWSTNSFASAPVTSFPAGWLSIPKSCARSSASPGSFARAATPAAGGQR